MKAWTRRGTLALGVGAAGAALLGADRARAAVTAADVPAPDYPIEDGASLRVLRPTKFVDPDQTIFLENTDAFAKANGIDVRVDFAGWEDLRPQTAVSANVGSGPDVIVGWTDDPHLYADKVLDVTDLATYLGERYGGWYDIAARLGKRHGTEQWISIPMGGSGGPLVYRKSWVQEAGFEKPPADLDGFLQLCRKMKEIGHPPGFALGNAVGDGNAFAHWLVWSHGGAMTDEEGNVTINSPETIAALDYAKALYETFVPGTLSWLDPSNNKAFTAGEIGITSNGVSLYFSIKNNPDPAIAANAADVDHALMPVGPVGRVTQTALVVNAMVMGYTSYPNAAKAYLKWMMEKEQYDRWLTGCLGYWAQPLQAYERSDVWSSDPKILPYRDSLKNALWLGYKGPISEASGAAVADYVMVQMVSSVCSGQATPADAAAEAERRARRYYRS